MKAKRMTAAELAKLLFDNRGNIGFSVDYFETGLEDTGKYEWAHSIGIIRFAEASMVVGNYYGGGRPFCYDLTDDTDESGLADILDSYFSEMANPSFVYVECEDKTPYWPDVVIVVDQGMATDVYSKNPNTTVQVVDLDTDDEERKKEVQEVMREVSEAITSGALTEVYW